LSASEASWPALVLLSVAAALGMPVTGAAQPGVRTDSRLPGYEQMFRPQVHFSPARNWMNDPNGLVYFDGWYHLFFQYNPYGERWGHMSWGHAVSRDLVHWQELPVAIPQGRRFMIFSGSAVADRRDTSGFGTGRRGPPLVAVYTAQPRAGGGPQTQNIAYSTDGGMTWTKYRRNPVLDIGLRDFRDPKVFWYAPQHKWVMVVARAAAREVSFYSSGNLRTWTHTGDFGPAGDTQGVWECPDLLQLPVENRPGETRWMLKVDAQHNQAGGGGGGQVFVGRFDGTTFIPSSRHSQALDLGEDYYASASWSNLPPGQARHVMLGWMDKWTYAQDTPTSPWRGAMAFPREVSLRWQGGAYRLMQRPVTELARLRRAHRRLQGFAAPGGRALLAVPARGGAHEVRAFLHVGSRGRFTFTIGSSDDRQVEIAYDAAAHRISVTRRGRYRFSRDFAAANSAPLPGGSDLIELDMIIDRSSVEAFVNDGEMTIAERMFPSGGAYTVAVRTDEARCDRIDIWDLQSIWR